MPQVTVRCAAAFAPRAGSWRARGGRRMSRSARSKIALSPAPCCSRRARKSSACSGGITTSGSPPPSSPRRPRCPRSASTARTSARGRRREPLSESTISIVPETPTTVTTLSIRREAALDVQRRPRLTLSFSAKQKVYLPAGRASPCRFHRRCAPSAFCSVRRTARPIVALARLPGRARSRRVHPDRGLATGPLTMTQPSPSRWWSRCRAG
jgi:hypothetical protein